jgi:hypothetical protein
MPNTPPHKRRGRNNANSGNLGTILVCIATRWFLLSGDAAFRLKYITDIIDIFPIKISQ